MPMIKTEKQEDITMTTDIQSDVARAPSLEDTNSDTSKRKSSSSFPRVDVERLRSTHLTDEPVKDVKVEKPEDPQTQLSNWSAEPEVISLDDDSEEEEECEGPEYKYFCLECEGCAGNPSCDHTTHPRVPVPFDLREHFKTTGHVAVR